MSAGLFDGSFSDPGRRGLGLGQHLGDMAHLPARARRPLAVDVHSGTGNGEPTLVTVDLVPDQIGHGNGTMPDRLSERPAGNGADMLLELRDRGTVQRPVSGIMYSRSDLIDQDFRLAIAFDHEQFYRQHADVVQRGGDSLGYAASLRRQS